MAIPLLEVRVVGKHAKYAAVNSSIRVKANNSLFHYVMPMSAVKQPMILHNIAPILYKHAPFAPTKPY